MLISQKDQKRFFEKVNKTNSCWEWIASKDTYNYGKFRFGNKLMMAHRFSWEIHNGPIPKGLYVCHKCDNPSCVNPAHLFTGTQSDNIMDASRKGRLPDQKGEAGHASKFTKEEESLIYEEYQGMKKKSQRKLGKKHGVAHKTIGNIIKRSP